MQKIICYLKWLWKKVICNEHGTWVAVAIGGAAVVGAGAGIVTSSMSADAAEDAANAQANAAKQGVDVQWAMYKQSREDYAPWRTAGNNAVANLAAKVAAGPGDFYKSPGYDFRLAEGQKALERSAAARTGALGADTERALIRYNQDYATNEYDNFLSRYYQSLTPYQSLSGVGQTATAGTTMAGTNAANSIAQGALAAGNAQAAGYINSANAITGGIQSVGNNALAGYNAWRQYNSGNSGYAPPTYNASNAGAMTDYGSGNYFKTVDPNLL
jgi:hypothetical protein